MVPSSTREKMLANATAGEARLRLDLAVVLEQAVVQLLSMREVEEVKRFIDSRWEEINGREKP
jgi:hypothetical protein